MTTSIYRNTGIFKGIGRFVNDARFINETNSNTAKLKISPYQSSQAKKFVELTRKILAKKSFSSRMHLMMFDLMVNAASNDVKADQVSVLNAIDSLRTNNYWS